MTRVQQAATVTKRDVLDHLARTIGPFEVFVQVGASVVHQNAITALVDGDQVGMLHLGPGRYQNLEPMMPHLVKGAIILFEDCHQDTMAYNYAIGLAARGYLSGTDPIAVRFWDGLRIATYLGGTK